MSFADIPKVEKYQFYLDVALKRARTRSEMKRRTLISKKVPPLGRERESNIYRMDVFADALSSQLDKLLTSFPSIDSLTPFYHHLVKSQMDYVMLKKSLASLKWAKQKIAHFKSETVKKLTMTREVPTIKRHVSAGIGRISSVVKQIRNNLDYLQDARKILVNFPVVKSGMPTIVLTGLPNVGKTTLFAKLTGSKPEIANYDFTTKGINIGYLDGEKKVQVLDTPGVLGRPDKENPIEMFAVLALEHVADLIVFMPHYSGITDQDKKLLKFLKTKHKDVYVYENEEKLREKILSIEKH